MLFSSPNALHGLGELSVWWLRLGIKIERIKPGNPQQNGLPLRMHRTLKQETAKPAAFNLLQQQEKFDKFIKLYNNERPHQGIANKYPADLYTPSTRVYNGLPDIDYHFAERIITVTKCGRICIGKRKINLSTVFAGQNVGITQIDDTIWSVHFMDYVIGYFDTETSRVEPSVDPFRINLLPLS